MATPAEIVAEFFELAEVPELAPRYNIAPTQPVAAVVASPEANRGLRTFRWGLVPSFASDAKSGASMINARAETLADKPAFRDAFRFRRCLVIADGFYEWRKLGKSKQPYYIRMADGTPFAFAGLWERWRGPEGDPIESCTVVTCEPNDLVRDLHDRMPAILGRRDYAAWLDPGDHDTKSLERLLRPYPADQMTALAVSTRVNRPENEDVRCIEPTGGLLFE